MIDNVDFHNLEVQKYWSFPKSYKKDPKAETKNMIFSGDYIGARKMDGAFYKFVKNDDGTMELLGRSKSVSGDYLNKIDWVPQLMPFFEMLPKGTCLLGEVYFPNKEGSSNVTTIMGCLKDKAITRQEKGDKLHYYIFDVLAYNGQSIYKKNIEERISLLDHISNFYNDVIAAKYIEFAVYYGGAELWDHLAKTLNEGGEGIVMTKKGTCYQPGKRPARQTLKVKKEVSETIDVIIVSENAPTHEYTGKEIETWKFWEDMITGQKIEGQLYKDYSNGRSIIPVTKNHFYGWAGSFNIGVVRDNKIVTIGSISGLTEEVLSNFPKYKGQIAEITCMEVLPTMGLRHPKFVKWRPDLCVQDATWEKIYGEA